MKIVKKMVEQTWLTGPELSKYLDLSPARISQLTSEGILERGRYGYDLELAIACYGRYILAPHLFV